MRVHPAAMVVLVVAVTVLSWSPASAVEVQAAGDETTLQAVELPVSLERIRRQLDKLPIVKDESEVLRLSFYVEVYGRSPRVNVFEGYDLHNGPVPYGAPTHTTMRDIVTPLEFKTPAVNVGNIIGWAWRQVR